MSCDFEALDALAAGELDQAASQAVRSHAQQCARCTHELAWLRTERVMFRQRACAPVKEDFRPRRTAARWRVGAMAVAACLAAVAIGPRVDLLRRAPEPQLLESVELSERPASDPRWVIASLEAQFGACLIATPRDGLQCAPGPESYASYAQ